MSTRDGGSAFPFVARTTPQPGQEVVIIEDGMTMRQWYKGKALMGFCARMARSRYSDLEYDLVGGRVEAKIAGVLADRMLAEDEEREDAPSAPSFTKDHLRAVVLAGGYHHPEGVSVHYADGRLLPDAVLAEVADLIGVRLPPED